MAYQFIHYETYNLKEAIDNIKEGLRIPGHCPHVKNPEPPTIILGNPENFIDEIQDLKQTTKRRVEQKTKKGELKTIERKIRDNERIVLFGIFSFPRKWSEDNPRLKRECQEEAIEKLKLMYGDQLKVVLFHDDEAEPHVHFWVVPDDLKIENVCRAAAAEKKFDVSNKKDTRKERDEIRLHAMQDYQTEWHRDVFGKYGLVKEGPKRRRMSRVSYLAEKETMLDIAKSNQAVRDIKKNLAGVQAAMLSQNLRHQNDMSSMTLKMQSMKRSLTKSEQVQVSKELEAVDDVKNLLGI